MSLLITWETTRWQTSQTSFDHHQHASSIHPPPTTKDQLGPPDSCTSLPLWLTQLGFSSFILNPILTLLLSYFKQTIHPASDPSGWRTNAWTSCFVSNSERQFVVLALQLHPSRRIPVLERISGCCNPENRRGDTEQHRKCSVIFDRGPENHIGDCHNNAIKII